MTSTRNSNNEQLVRNSIAGCELSPIKLTNFKSLTTNQEAVRAGGSSNIKSERDCKSNTDSSAADDGQQFEIIWRDVAFEVQQSDSAIWRLVGQVSSETKVEAAGGVRRFVLENSNGYAKSGELTAILGPSGSGKTSLLNAICGKTENYRGSIQLIGGAERRMRLSIIPQKDYLLDNLTVRESLLFASKILDPNKSSSEHEANISRVVKMLNLIGCLDSEVSKISGGEYKRVSIAQELISQPDILVLDEPTSGLDWLNCKQLIRALIKLVEASRRGKIKPLAVIMTIHQPDIDVFNIFDHVYCMARGGNVIYDGHPRDAMQTIRDYAQFEQDNMPAELQNYGSATVNPANLLIEIASGDIYGRGPIKNLAHLQQTQFKQLYEATPSPAPSGCGTDASSYGPLNKRDSDVLVRDKRLSSKRRHPPGLFWYHFGLLTQRTLKVTGRDPLLCYASLLFYVSFPFVLYPFFPKNFGSSHACPVIVREFDILSLGTNKTLAIASDLQEQLRLGREAFVMFFLMMTSFSLTCIGTTALAFPLSMQVLLKELRNGWYDLTAYVGARTVAGVPFQVGLPVASIIILYLLLELPESYMNWRLWGFALSFACITLMGQTIGLIFGALFMDNASAAIAFAFFTFMPQTILSGNVYRLSKMPVIFQYLSWLTPPRHVFVLILMFRYGFGVCPCSEELGAHLAASEPKFLMSSQRELNQMLGFYFSNMLPTAAAADDDLKLLSGPTNDLILKPEERDQVVQQFNTHQFDLFQRLADQFARSFAFGEKIDSCRKSRSKVLSYAEAPDEMYAGHLLCCLIFLLIALRSMLFYVVRLKVNSKL